MKLKIVITEYFISNPA